MTNPVQRSITGLILAIVIILAVTYGLYSFLFLILVIDILALLEFYRLFRSAIAPPRNILGVIVSVGLLTTVVMVICGFSDWQLLLINIPLAFSVFVIELFLRSVRPFHALGLIFLGIIIITLPLIFFVALSVLPAGMGKYPYVTLGYFFILWTYDSGAYFTGRYLGMRALFPRISPKKTWEGLTGGAACALLVAFLISSWYPILGTKEWLTFAMIIIVSGTFGDLIKSLMKRSLGVKDSGRFLPGHGGLLDRFDTLLGSAPFVFCYLALTGHI